MKIFFKKNAITNNICILGRFVIFFVIVLEIFALVHTVSHHPENEWNKYEEIAR